MMKTSCRVACLLLVLGASVGAKVEAYADDVKERTLDASNNVKINVRMEGPYTADAPLQVVCYFKYTPAGAKRMSGAPVELDKRLGGVIASLRERGEFIGDQLETLYLIPPKNSIKAKGLLLVGLGSEDELSLNLLEAVGRVALRAVARRGVERVAFAPLIRDQGNSKFAAGEVATAVVRGMLLAYDTESRLAKEGLANPYILKTWNMEAGQAYFDETAAAVEKAIKQATATIKDRGAESYRRAN